MGAMHRADPSLYIEDRWLASISTFLGSKYFIMHYLYMLLIQIQLKGTGIPKGSETFMFLPQGGCFFKESRWGKC